MAEDKNITLARDYADKFEYYFIALVFTVLGLSIQTAPEIKSFYWNGYFEFTAWFLIAVSGICGLSRLKWKGVLYNYHGAVRKDKARIEELEQAISAHIRLLKPDMQPWTEAELKNEIKILQERLDKREKLSAGVEQSCQFKYSLHQVTFLFGLVLLMISRIIGKLAHT